MSEAHGYLRDLLGNLKRLRERAGKTEAQLEEKLVLGPGWISRFERGETVPNLDILLAVLHELGTNLTGLLESVPDHPSASEVQRYIYAEQDGADLIVRFRYAAHDASFMLRRAKLTQFETVIKTMRDGLARLARVGDEGGAAEAVKTEAVARSFLTAAQQWPHANPSDLWYLLVYRAFCDPYNHPAQFARGDLSQSWRRTGGWALEEILVRHYMVRG